MAWMLWCVIVFGVYNAGAPHVVSQQIQRAIWDGVPRRTAGKPLTVIRSYLTDDGDLARYFAYSRAALGRPFQPWYVRTAAEWENAFRDPWHGSHPDDVPVRVPHTASS